MRIYKDPWLSYSTSFKVIFSCILSENTYVDYLINEAGLWKENLIRSAFMEQYVEAILRNFFGY